MPKLDGDYEDESSEEYWYRKAMSGPLMVDDNFGAYTDTDDPEVRSFYFQVQKRSVWKECEGCGRRVKLLPHYAYCNSCADAIERGYGC